MRDFELLLLFRSFDKLILVFEIVVVSSEISDPASNNVTNV